MGYENDLNRDEDGEPLMDFDDEFQSDQDPQADSHLLLDDEDNDNDDWRRRERSPTPVFNEFDSKSKPRKRLLKKNAAADSAPDFGIGDYDEDDPESLVRDDSNGENQTSSGGGKRKKFALKDKRKEKKLKVDKREKSGVGDKSGPKFKVNKR